MERDDLEFTTPDFQTNPNYQSLIYTEVSARGAAITVGQDGRKKTGFLDPNATFYDTSQFQNKVRKNKLIYYWEEEGEPMDTSD